jgi:hypothetical protein
MTDDITEHVAEVCDWLHSIGFEGLESITLDEWTKHRLPSERHASGRFAYRIWENRLKNGAIYLVAKARIGEVELSFQTRATRSGGKYFFQAIPKPVSVVRSSEKMEQTSGDLQCIAAFWEGACPDGTANYLHRKQVGSYGLRFCFTDRFGATALVPMRDRYHVLRGIQFLNADSTKPMHPGSQLNGCAHRLGGPIAQEGPILLTEGYATAAFLYELLGFPVVCCFSSCNLCAVAAILREIFLKARIYVAVDNDRHLATNVGVMAGLKASQSIGGCVLTPDFGSVAAAKNASDWLDLCEHFGREVVLEQLRQQGLPQAH